MVAPDAEPGPADLEGLTRAWLEELRLRAPVGDYYGPDLELAGLAAQLVDTDRRREGIRLLAGSLEIARLDVHDSGLVDLEATVVYPADRIARGKAAAFGRAREELRIELGAAYWERDDEGRWRLHDYVRGERRMSATWCTHPLGQDASDAAGIGVVPQAITVDGPRVGRVFLEVRSERDQPTLLRVGRPPRPQGVFRRQPPVGPPPVGILLPPHGSTHLVGRSSRPKLTEVEIFAFDEASLAPLAELRVQAELPRRHPGADGLWCTDLPDQ